MPVRRITPIPPEDAELFTEALVRELNSPSREDTAQDVPFIIEDEDARFGKFAVTVLWDRWGDLGLPDRGGIILDAYRTAKGEAAASKISRALGLTHLEAERIGIRY